MKWLKQCFKFFFGSSPNKVMGAIGIVISVDLYASINNWSFDYKSLLFLIGLIITYFALIDEIQLKNKKLSEIKENQAEINEEISKLRTEIEELNKAVVKKDFHDENNLDS